MTTPLQNGNIQEHEINCLGLKCPLPVIRLEKAFAKGHKTMTLLADDPVSVIDIPLCVSKLGGKLTQEKLANQTYIFRIKLKD